MDQDNRSDAVGINLKVVLPPKLKQKLDALVPELKSAVLKAIAKFFEEYNANWPDEEGSALRMPAAQYFIHTRLKRQIGDSIQHLAANAICFGLNAKSPVLLSLDKNGKLVEEGVTVPRSEVDSMIKLAALSVKDQLRSRGRGRPEETKDQFLGKLAEAIRDVGDKKSAVAAKLDWEVTYLSKRHKHFGFDKWTDTKQAVRKFLETPET